MKSKKKVIEENPHLKTLINAVWAALGEPAQNIKDINKHGIQGGYGNFVYYSDTVAFYKRHRKTINEMVFEMGRQLGESPVEMVGSFNCLKGYNYESKRWSDEEMRDEIGRCIYGGSLRDIGDTVPNALAWFAAEEVCRLFENE
jgi:hypothetical protein